MSEGINYYSILDLDPAIDDWPSIEAAIEKKRGQWAMEASHGMKERRLKAQEHLSDIEHIKETLKDADLRREMARARRKEVEREKQEKFERFREQVDTIRQSEQFSPEVLQRLKRSFKRVLTEKEIEEQLEKANFWEHWLNNFIARHRQSGRCGKGELQEIVECLKPGFGESHIVGMLRKNGIALKEVRKTEGLDEDLMKRIQRELDFIGLADLYALLGGNQRTPWQQLRAKAEAEANELIRLGKTEPKITSRKTLLSMCQTQVFCDEDTKQKYNISLSQARLHELDPHIEGLQHDGSLAAKAVDTLVLKAREKGIDEETALNYLFAFAEKRNLKVQSPDTGLSSSALLTCGFCNALAGSPSDVNCRDCGEPLRVDCPKCGNPTPTQDRSCSKCGCNVESAPMVYGYLKTGRALLVQGRVDEAMKSFRSALVSWPDWKPPQLEIEKIQERELQVRQLQHKIDKLIENGEYSQANDCLREAAELWDANQVESYRKKLAGHLETARRLYAEGEALQKEGKTDDAFRKYDQALSACRDFKPAIETLKACPPQPPGKLTVASGLGPGFHLGWIAADSPGRLTYEIIRKEGGPPHGRGDGKRVGEVPSLIFHDDTAEPGVVYYYAAYTKRHESYSVQASSSEPCLRLSDVTNLEICARSREVTITYEPPRGCKRVDIWRREGGPPSKYGEGQRLLGGSKSAVDKNLSNNNTYGYLIVAVFDHPALPGRELMSPGLKKSAVPVALPEPVTDLVCRRTDEVVVLSWKSPQTGSVQIRSTVTRPEYTPGTVIPIEEADRFGRPVVQSGSGSAQAVLDHQGRTYFIPLSVAAGTAVLGKYVVATKVEAVRNARCRVSGRSMILTWEWPEGIEEVLVCFSGDGKISGPDDVRPERVKVTKREYDHSECWELKGADQEAYNFALFARGLGDDAYSDGVELHTLLRQHEVRYRVVVKRSPFFGPVRDVYCELSGANVTQLTNLVGISTRRHVPTSLDDGKVCFETRRLSFEGGRARIPIAPEHWDKNAIVRIFFRSRDDNPNIRLLPASSKDLKLG